MLFYHKLVIADQKRDGYMSRFFPTSYKVPAIHGDVSR